MPTPEAISSIYNSHYYRDENQEHGYSDYAADEEFIKRSYRRRLLKISSLSLSNPPEPHIHEIGCALGFGLSEAQNIFPNAKVTGSDISTEAVTFARNLGFEAYLCDEKGSSSCFEHEGQADLVYLFDVIEHLPDIPAFKSWATEQLSDNGQMLITTPDMGSVINRLLGPRSPSIKIPQHIIYFDSATLSNALAPQFKLVDSWIDIQDVGIGMLLNRILHILRLKPINILEKLKFGIPVPNGIQLYLFEKC